MKYVDRQCRYFLAPHHRVGSQFLFLNAATPVPERVFSFLFCSPALRCGIRSTRYMAEAGSQRDPASLCVCRSDLKPPPRPDRRASGRGRPRQVEGDRVPRSPCGGRSAGLHDRHMERMLGRRLGGQESPGWGPESRSTDLESEQIKIMPMSAMSKQRCPHHIGPRAAKRSTASSRIRRPEPNRAGGWHMRMIPRACGRVEAAPSHAYRRAGPSPAGTGAVVTTSTRTRPTISRRGSNDVRSCYRHGEKRVDLAGALRPVDACAGARRKPLTDDSRSMRRLSDTRA